MSIKTSIAIGFIAFLFACNTESNEVYHESENSAPKFQEEDFRGELTKPLKDEISEFSFFPDRYSFNDVDEFYRNQVEASKNEDFSINLKNHTFSLLWQVYNIDEVADEKTLRFYVNEMMGVPYLNNTSSRALAAILKALKETTGREKEVARLAEKRYVQNMEYIRENFVNWEEALEEARQEQAALASLYSDAH
jgi:hypothetical protein